MSILITFYFLFYLDYLENDGLAILMKIALLYKDDVNVSINLSKILSYMSISDSVIEPIFNTGIDRN